MRRIAWFLMFCITMSFGHQAIAAGDGCSDVTITPSVGFRILDAQVAYDFSQSANDIRALAASLGNPIAEQSRVILRGLTVANYTWQVEVASSAYAARGGGWCVFPKEVTLSIGYSGDMMVYVQSEYPEGTCQNQAILAHENTHVLINRETLVEYLPHFREAIEAVMKSSSFPAWFESKERGADYAVKSIETAIEVESNAFLATRDARHANLDSPASLSMTRASCLSW